VLRGRDEPTTTRKGTVTQPLNLDQLPINHPEDPDEFCVWQHGFPTSAKLVRTVR
jgi:hypothetical protein